MLPEACLLIVCNAIGVSPVQLTKDPSSSVPSCLGPRLQTADVVSFRLFLCPGVSEASQGCSPVYSATTAEIRGVV